MYPSIFISNQFWELFEEYRNEISSYPFDDNNITLEQKRSSFFRIRSLILSSNIYTDEDIKFEDYSENNGVYENFKKLVFSMLVDDYLIATSKIIKPNTNIKNCKKPDFCFFTNNSFEFCDSYSKKNGIVYLGENFLNTPFYLKNSFPLELTTEKIHQVEKIKHPCNSLIILDSFLFNGAGKITHLINFIENMLPEQLSNKFQIDIIIQNPYDDQKIQKAYDKIIHVLKDKISLYIIALIVAIKVKPCVKTSSPKPTPQSLNAT